MRSRYQYFLAGVGDEPQVNLTLSERLKRDFKIQLPELGEDEQPEAYLVRVQEEVCKDRKRWGVRRFVTLAHFPFARLSMFNDLDETLWTKAGALASRPLVQQLLGGSEAGSSIFADEHDVDAPEIAAKATLVLEADASQHSAVYDVVSGKNLVIEGPPGTGKSQTITNIIAAALANRKRVLFVADKQAALQVVKDRLDMAGLGDFCLELHSGKARKKDVVDALRKRLERRPTTMGVAELDEKLRELCATRSALTRYVQVLNTPLGASGATVHDVLWADRRRRDREGEEARCLDALPLPGCESLVRSDIERRQAVLDRFERSAHLILAAFGSPDRHPWYGVTRDNLSSVDFEQVVRDAEDVASAMKQVDRTTSDLRAVGLETGVTIQDVRVVACALKDLPVRHGVDAKLYLGLRTPHAQRAAEDWLHACKAYQGAVATLRQQNVASDGLDGAEAAKTWPRAGER